MFFCNAKVFPLRFQEEEYRHKDLTLKYITVLSFNKIILLWSTSHVVVNNNRGTFTSITKYVPVPGYKPIPNNCISDVLINFFLISFVITLLLIRKLPTNLST